MNDEVSRFLKEYIEIIDKHKKFLFYTRGIEFQKYSVMKLEEFEEKLVALKKEMIRIKDEESANIMLSLENLLNTYVNELKMLIFLKEDKMDEAWKTLIEAQYLLRNSCQANDIAFNLDAENYSQELFLIEKLFFPPQVFQSIGVVVESSKCSICNQEYGKCNHIKGKPYMGELCFRVITKIKDIREVSLLTVEPANKLCKVDSFTDSGHWRDIMTWRVKKKQEVGSRKTSKSQKPKFT